MNFFNKKMTPTYFFFLPDALSTHMQVRVTIYHNKIFAS